MRRRSISTATALAVLFSSAALSVVAAGTASAAPASVYAVGGFVVDGAIGRVFVGDAETGKVFAADYSGNQVGEVDGITDVTDLALSDDGSTLYAAASGNHQIVALDAATLDVKTRYTVPTTTGPTHVAVSGGKVWFTYGDQWAGDLGSVDPAAGTVTTDHYSSKLWGQALLDTDPGRPGVLAVGETGMSTDSMAVLDVSSGAPQQVAYYHGDYSLNSGIQDIDLVPGGTHVLVNGTERQAYANGTFTADGAYPKGTDADIAPNGLVAQANGATVSVYRPDETVPIRTYDTGSSGAKTPLAWSPDSAELFALVVTNSGWVVTPLGNPTLEQPTLTVNAPSTATGGKQLTVSGTLSTPTQLPAGTGLTVVRTDTENPKGTVLPAVTVQADGSYSFTDTPYAGGTATYKVSYAGDGTHAAATATAQVKVSFAAPSVTLNNNGKVYDYNKAVTFTAHLGSTYKNRTVEIWANPYGADKPNKLVKSGTVDSGGNLSVTINMVRDTDVTAVFKGDTRTAAKTVKSTAYAHVADSLAVSRQYKTAKIGTTPYYWFHKNVGPQFTTTMTYYPGRKQRLELEVYVNGKWVANGSQYFRLGTNGKSVVVIPAPGHSGIKARIRSSYIDGTSGDTVNTTTYGSWKYLYFTN
ncbi:NHL repeat-containing protein [Streptomyces gibsoniae]|uniref:Ig-like domain repeat protein n=1 Tax=Streptomyces gibsoniae TaxID=3075529 RepID=A0ABU2TSP3_9ACTN|nr:Ig-like domain repeat protein [Streptomyces sp. DSM 41699]MDT0463946.1 Ig-like domain repeat protein [Streptomyces sp. DSM 41699]